MRRLLQNLLVLFTLFLHAQTLYSRFKYKRQVQSRLSLIYPPPTQATCVVAVLRTLQMMIALPTHTNTHTTHIYKIICSGNTLHQPDVYDVLIPPSDAGRFVYACDCVPNAFPDKLTRFVNQFIAAQNSSDAMHHSCWRPLCVVLVIPLLFHRTIDVELMWRRGVVCVCVWHVKSRASNSPQIVRS